MDLNAKVNNEIVRRDFPIILALNKHLATVLPVVLKHDSEDGYVAGQVLVRNTSTGYFEKYSAASGTYDAAAILMDNVYAEEFSGTTGLCVSRGIFGGEVFKAKLTDLDSGAITDLGAKTIIDATGVEILKF